MNTLNNFLEKRLECDDCGGIHHKELKEEAIKWIKKIHIEQFPLFPNKEVKLPWFGGDEITLTGGDQIFAAKVVLQAFFNIRQEDLKC